MEFEKLVKEIMAEAKANGEPVTEAEAKEMAEMEIKAKGITHYEHSAEKKARKPREKKIDTVKADIIRIIAQSLKDNGYDIVISNEDKSIDFDNYTVNLVKHRPKK